jgi:ribokinase
MGKPIVVVGSLNIDFVVNLQRHPAPGETVAGRRFDVFPGGKGANQAYAAARLGGSVAMLGQVGNDAQAPWLKQHLAEGGVDVSAIQIDPALSSGVAVITIDADGQNRIVVVPGSNGTFTVDRLEQCATLIQCAAIVLLQLEIPLDTVTRAARLAREAGAIVVLDPAPAQAVGAELLESVDYLTPNETELEALTGGASPSGADRHDVLRRADQLRERGARNVIVKMGSAGALLLGSEGEHHWPAFPVQAIDTTAAGDAFNGAFAVELADGKSARDAGRFACAAAAVCVTRPGAQPSMPTRDEVEAMLRPSRGLGPANS